MTTSRDSSGERRAVKPSRKQRKAGKLKPCKVRIIKRDGYSVGVSDRPITLKQIKDALADFP